MIVDVIIFLLILSSALLGLKRGFTKELVCFLGFFIIIILAFILKNPLSSLMYEYLPFFKFSWIIKGATSLNIILYEIISFFIVLSLLTIIFKVLVFATTIFEKILKITVVLGIPSKILGFVVGILEGIVWSFIILYIINLPFFKTNVLTDSKIASSILNKTPILTTMTKDTIKASEEVSNLIDDYKTKNKFDSSFDYKAIDIMLEHNIVKPSSIEKLKEKNKIKVKNIDKLIEKYKE